MKNRKREGGREERGKGGREEKRCMCVFCKLAHYFEAKVGRGHLLRLLAALLNMYYGKCTVPVLILS